MCARGKPSGSKPSGGKPGGGRASALRPGGVVAAVMATLAALGPLYGCRTESTISLHPGAGERGVQGDTLDASLDASLDANWKATLDASLDPRDPPPRAVPDAGVPDAATTPAKALLARYDFSGTGTRIIDRVGSADGVAMGGATLSGAGTLSLDGDDDFVDLPNGLVSRLETATVMAWVTWAGGVCWQRIFDFGSSDRGEGEVGNVATSIFLTPLVCGRGNAAAYMEIGSVQYAVHLDAPLPADQKVQVALTVDAPGDAMRLYVDGELAAQAQAPFTLSAIEDQNVWLGRSQWVQDRNLTGTYDEFRIYARALTGREVRQAYLQGPDAP